MLKKLFTVAITATTLCAPIAALADLIIHNNTDEYSSVRIIANQKCSGTYGFITKPHDSLLVRKIFIKSLCDGAEFCKADIIQSTDADLAGICGGETPKIIGNATLDTKNQVVSEINVTDDAYHIDGLGTSEVTIGK